ncbi:MAG: alkaline phosphatase family protein [bacterium]
MKTKSQRGRVIIIGLDGATPELVERLCAKGVLPGISALMEKGIYIPLKSTTPAHSGPAWTSFATGKNPGKTGVYSYQRNVKGQYRQELVFSTGMLAEPIWRIANRQGFSAGLINVIFTYPPEEIDGYVLSGLPTRDYHFYPEKRFAEAFKNIPKKFNPSKKVALWNKCYRDALIKDANRKNIFLYMNKNHPADLQIVIFELADRLQHRYWHCMDETHPAHTPELASRLGDAIETGYKILDGFVSEIAGDLEPGDTLFVVSDHGLRACAKTFHLNNFLMEKKLLYFKRGFDASKFKPDTEETFYHTALYENIDWKRTKAFFTHEDLMVCAGLRINVKGREPLGIVNPGAEFDSLREEIRAAILALRDPESGERFIENVYYGEELYSGKYASLAPDLLVESKYRLSPIVAKDALFTAIEPLGIMEKTEDFAERNLTGHHSKNGIFIAFGPDIRGRLESADITDVAPTALYALGATIPDDMDGKVLPAFTKMRMKKRPVCYKAAIEAKNNNEGAPGISPEDMKKAEETLKGLGYFD